MEQEEKEIKTVTSVFMIIVALLFDGVQALINLIPVVGQVLSFFISVLSFLTFYVWFKMNGVTFAKPKRVLKFGGSFFVELIPILNILPALSLAVFMMISETKMKKVLAQVPGGDKVTSVVSGNKPKVS